MNYLYIAHCLQYTLVCSVFYKHGNLEWFIYCVHADAYAAQIRIRFNWQRLCVCGLWGRG